MVELYVSTDIEADGPIPGPHSMLSFASAVYLPDKTLLATFWANLELLPGATGHPRTMEWWKNHRQAWEYSRKDPRAPEVVIPEYVEWLKSLPGVPVFVAYPLGYDFTFVHWYLMRFADENPFRQHGIDIRTYAMAVLKRDYKQCGKDKLPKRWFDKLPHTHNPLQDAMEQGALFCNMLMENTAVTESASSEARLRPSSQQVSRCVPRED